MLEIPLRRWSPDVSLFPELSGLILLAPLLVGDPASLRDLGSLAEILVFP